MIDIGVNLINHKFRGLEDIVLKDAKNAGVEQIILTGTKLKNSQQALRLTKKYPDYLKTTIGVHPHYANEYNSELHEELIKMLNDPLAVAVGECGLDFDRNYSTHKEQYYAFEQQLLIAEQVDKPLFLHERNAHKEFITIMKQHGSLIPKSVVHCFTSGKEDLKAYLDLGFYIGITGWVTDLKRGSALREAVEYIPLDRLMIETDAPFLTPKNMPKPAGGVNEPQYLPYVAQEIAKIRGIEVDELVQSVTATTKSFFDIE